MSYQQYKPAEKFPPAIKNIILINVTVWIAQIVLDNKLPPIPTPPFGTPEGFLTGWLALWPVATFDQTPGFRVWQIVTHMFTHAASGSQMYFHILFNMFSLWMFGRVLENVWGSKRFVIFYMICGLGSAALHLVIQYFTGGYEIAVGASGAVFGVLVAFALTFPNTELYIMFIPVPIKAKWAILGLVLLDLFGGLYQASGDNIAHYAHLGGAVTGFILLKVWNKTNRNTLY